MQLLRALGLSKGGIPKRGPALLRARLQPSRPGRTRAPAALAPAAPSRGWSLSGTSVPLRGDPTRFVAAFVTCGGPTHSQGTEASGVPAAAFVV